MKFKPIEVGVYTGLFFAVLHAIWSLMVFAKVAKGFLDFAFGLHFLNNPFVIKPFALGNAIELAVFVFVVWFIIGYLSTIAWNMMQKGK